MSLPTFVHLGPGKTGTTALRMNLLGHPEIALSSVGEPSFFSTDRPKKGRRHLETLAEYEALFEPTSTTRVIGDISPSYLPSLDAARNMHQVLPDARLVVCLRHPVERAFSHYLMLAGARGWEAADFEPRLIAAIDSYAESGRPDDESWFATTSLYANAIGRVLEHYDREQLAVLPYDTLVERPSEWYAAFFAHIGLSVASAPAGTRKARVGIATPRSTALHRIVRGLTVVGASTVLPDRFKARLKRVYRLLNRQGPTRLPPHVTNRLYPLYREDVRRTSELVGLDLERLWSHRSTEQKPG